MAEYSQGVHVRIYVFCRCCSFKVTRSLETGLRERLKDYTKDMKTTWKKLFDVLSKITKPRDLRLLRCKTQVDCNDNLWYKYLKTVLLYQRAVLSTFSNIVHSSGERLKSFWLFVCLFSVFPSLFLWSDIICIGYAHMCSYYIRDLKLGSNYYQN